MLTILLLQDSEKELSAAKGFISANNLQASAYCFDKGINMEEALNWPKGGNRPSVCTIGI